MCIRHNGIVNSFFYADCDSITYAKEPMEASPQTTEFVQIIHMQDSVFRIPVNEIDSVSFYKPETVYQPGVIKLEEKLFSYVVRKDSLTLILSGNTPTELIPKQGDKLVTLEMNEIFPSGFMGEVVEVGKDANNYLVRCEPPLLTDILNRTIMKGVLTSKVPKMMKMRNKPLRELGEMWFGHPLIANFFSRISVWH